MNYVNDTVNAVCSRMNIPVDDFWSKIQSRQKPYSIARQIAMYVLKEKYKIISREAGRPFKKDHSTVVIACGVVKNYLEYDKELRSVVKDVEAVLFGGNLSRLVIEIQNRVQNYMPLDLAIVNEYNNKVNESKQGISDVPGDKPVPAPTVS